jgi:hypothetical protein
MLSLLEACFVGFHNVNTIINDKTGRLKKYNALKCIFLVLFSQDLSFKFIDLYNWAFLLNKAS